MTSAPLLVDHPRVRAWLEIRQPLETQLGPLGRAAMAVLRPASGERVLDIGCGIGGTPGLLAQAVGPRGRVVAMDLLQAAVDVARADPDLPANVSFSCGDAETHPLEPASFDAVFSRFGVMFFPDPVRAFGNIGRALRPGGRLGFVCWRGLDENELDRLPLRAATPHLPPQLVAESAAAACFSLSDAGTIGATLAVAGFVDVEVAPHDELVGCGSLRETVEVCSRVGALGAILREHPHLTRKAIAALEAALRDLDGPSGPRLRAATWIVTARRPD